MKAALLLTAVTMLYSCTPVSPYLLPPGGIKVGSTKASVEKVLGRPEEDIRRKDKLYYIYKQLQWVENSDRDIYETLFWIMEFDADNRVTQIEILEGSFFSVTSRRARQWVQQRTLRGSRSNTKIE